ncbi:MAG TPA: efflux RND transporter periplasmic adaptor subunit [Polyangiaceae bacterium]
MSGCFRSLLLVLCCSACRQASEPEPEPEQKVRVHCVSPTRQAFDESIELRGHLEPPPGGDLPLASQVAGRIIDVLVHEGQTVTLGQVVADVDDLATRDALRQAEASFAQASAAASNSKATLERTQALVGRGIAARQELDDTTAKAETDKQSVAASHAALDLARHTLGRVQVRSAFAGVVTKLWRGAGAIVDGTAATPIAQVAAAAGAEFVADATEADLQQISAGRPATISLGSNAPQLEGTIRAVSSSLDAATGLGTVRIALTAAPNLLMGAHGRVTIATRHRDAVLSLPAEALRGSVSDGAEVVVCADHLAKIRTIEVGYRDQHRLEVVSGLAEGERVAIDHVLGLDDGTVLTVVP